MAPHTTATADQAQNLDALLADGETVLRLRKTIDDAFDGRLCVRCMGRLLSRAARETPPEEKGHEVAEAADRTPVPDGDCTWCEGLFARTDRYLELIAQAAAPYEYDTMLLGTKLHPDLTEREARAQATLGDPLKEHFEPLRTELNRALGAILVPRLGKRVDFTRPDLLATLDPHFESATATPASVYLYGRYRKYDRDLPQTKWPCRACRGGGCKQCDGTGQQYASSVEALVAEAALPAFGATDESFHGSGREDIDALMLGTGRPFVLELKTPRVRTPRDGHATPEAPGISLAELEARINAHARPRVEVEGLRPSTKDEVVQIKAAAFDKAYRAHVTVEAPLHRHALEDAIAKVLAAPIEQRTPERVAHRRADKTRSRRVKTIAIAAWGHHARAAHEAEPAMQPVDAGADTATRFTLDILAEAGTYIKELVHGDDGRTQPSFAGLLGVPMKVAYLDVVGVGTELRGGAGPEPDEE